MSCKGGGPFRIYQVYQAYLIPSLCHPIHLFSILQDAFSFLTFLQGR